MELIFENIEEIIDFLKDIGYYIVKNNENIEKVTEEELEEEKGNTKDWIKDLPKSPYPYIPTNPYIPWYPNYPMVTFDAIHDPNLSSKFGTCSK